MVEVALVAVQEIVLVHAILVALEDAVLPAVAIVIILVGVVVVLRAEDDAKERVRHNAEMDVRVVGAHALRIV